MTQPDLDLVIMRTIDAPRTAVWQAWTVPEHLAQWRCPKPWRAEVR